MLPGVQPSLCSEIRLACYLKPYHVRIGVGGGEPPCMSQKPVILGEEGESKGERRREEKRGEERRGQQRRGEGRCSITVALTEAAIVPVDERGVHTSDSQSG